MIPLPPPDLRFANRPVHKRDPAPRNQHAPQRPPRPKPGGSVQRQRHEDVAGGVEHDEAVDEALVGRLSGEGKVEDGKGAAGAENAVGAEGEEDCCEEGGGEGEVGGVGGAVRAHGCGVCGGRVVGWVVGWCLCAPTLLFFFFSWENQIRYVLQI